MSLRFVGCGFPQNKRPEASKSTDYDLKTKHTHTKKHVAVKASVLGRVPALTLYLLVKEVRHVHTFLCILLSTLYFYLIIICCVSHTACRYLSN